MVSTRRTDSTGGGGGSDTATRSNGAESDGVGRECRKRRRPLSSDSDISPSTAEPSQEEDSWSSQQLRSTVRSQFNANGGVRELRNRFVCSDLTYPNTATKRVRSQLVRSCRLLYKKTAHSMSDDDDVNDGDDEEVIFPNHLKRRRKNKVRSLRPLKNQTYTDPRSPATHSNSSGDEKPETDLRRSSRKRSLKYDSMNTSWITDAQMVRGYPNFRFDFISDQEGSQHSAQQEHSSSNNNNNNPRRQTRRSINYETATTSQTVIATAANNSSTNNNNNNKARTDTNNAKKVRKSLVNGVEDRTVKEQKPANEPDNSEVVPETCNGNIVPASTSFRRLKKRSRRSLNYMHDPRYSPGKTINRTMSEKSSDSLDEEVLCHQRCNYQLRQRKPKSPNPVPSCEPSRRSGRLLHHSCARRRHDRSVSSDSSIINESASPRSRKLGKQKSKESLKSGSVGNVPAPLAPEMIDRQVSFTSVGGLDNHVRCLREMVVLPMMYPDVFRQFQIQPPRGILFHGPPGTGKTLLARALANECSFGSRRVSFFMRKGADLLCKWVGESEKQLRMLFEQADKLKPSIIFFDELDGLAPVRSSRQDQIHASIVSTLLALMDGLDDRGEVIVLGATNRVDAIDPALRRPGRFDRELHFPLPARNERESILRVHVSQWQPQPTKSLIKYLAEHSVGYCGSDLRALCSEAVIQGLRRIYPQVYTTDYRLQLDPSCVKVERVDFLRARSLLVPASQRVCQSLGRRLPTMLEPLIRKSLDTILTMFREKFPHGLDPVLANVKISNNVQRAQFIVTGESSAQGQSIYLVPALLYHMEHVSAYTLDLPSLYKQTGRSAEEACVEIFTEAKRNAPSIIYIPSLEQWWSLVGATLRAIFISQLTHLDPTIPILFLATANVTVKELPEQIGNIFSTYRKEVLHLTPPISSQRLLFFKPLLLDACLKPPKAVKMRPNTPLPLPRAPTPPPPTLTETEQREIYEKEEGTLRELRIFLRDICKKLASNRMFYMFTKPVNLNEVPDYLSIIKEPMDLETMVTKVDLHKYSSSQEFLADIDLICINALEYNPAKTSADKQIRHRACSLRDFAHALIKAEMDSEFEEQCRDIVRKRKERKASVTEFLPPFIHTVPLEQVDEQNDPTITTTTTEEANSLKPANENPRTNIHRKRGYCKKGQKRGSRNVLSDTQEQPSTAQQDQQPEKVNGKTVLTKSSSGDESKENKPEEKVESVEQRTDLPVPFTVNCDMNQMDKNIKDVSPFESTNDSKATKTLSPAIWPSFADLIDGTPQIDSESDYDTEQQSNEVTVNIDETELEKLLSHVVTVTKGSSVMKLMDLYGQLQLIVKKYAKTADRTNLPKDLEEEVSRF